MKGYRKYLNEAFEDKNISNEEKVQSIITKLGYDITDITVDDDGSIEVSFENPTGSMDDSDLEMVPRALERAGLVVDSSSTLDDEMGSGEILAINLSIAA